MGPAPISLPQFQKVLEQEPELITWSKPGEVIIRKDNSGKLGIKLQTYKGRRESFCVVTKVKEECHIHRGILRNFSRIVRVNFAKITQLSDREIKQALSSSPAGQNIALSVCCLEGVREPQNNNFVSYTRASCDGEPSLSTGNYSDETCVIHRRNDSRRNLVESDVSGVIQEVVCEGTGRRDVKCDVRGIIQEVLGDSTVGGDVAFRNNQNSSSETLGKAVHEGHRRSDDSGVNLSDDELAVTLTQPKQLGSHFRVSGSSSNQSVCSESSLRRAEMMSRKSKGDKSGKETFYNTKGGDRAELEPLRPKEAKSPSKTGKPDLRFHNFHTDGSVSMPMHSDAPLSMQDISFDQFEETATHSMPVGHISNCQCANCLTASSDAHCDHCGRKQSSCTVKSTPYSVALFVESPEEMQENYGEHLLKNPQLAVWETTTRVVEIDKGSGKDYGFSYKVKLGKNPDESVEVYTLVKHVDKTGPASGKLRVCDWIRSIDSTPIQDPKQISSLINNSSNHTLRVVIQRPVGFSHHPKKPSPYSPAMKHISSSPSTSGGREQVPLLPGTTEQPKRTEEKVRAQNTIIPGINPNSSLVPFPKIVKFPKVRIFVCGSEAEKCATYILRDSDIEISFSNYGYTHVDFSMATDPFGNVVISKVCSNLYSACSQSLGHASTDISATSDNKCKGCGNDFSTDGQQHPPLRNVINVEMHVITDDKFFHNSCSVLFTKASVFLLTFDCAKLLRSTSTEFTRMQNLSHSIRSFADECHITMCGLVGSLVESNHIMDEVRALFYGPFNTQLQQYNVCGPELFNTQIVPTDSCNTADTHGLQVLLWKSISDSIQRQSGPQPALLIMDYLYTIKDKDMIVTEDDFMALIQKILPEYEQDVHYTILTDLAWISEIIRGKATLFNVADIYSIEQLIILNPKILLEHLHNLVITLTEDKVRWSRTHSTGFISAHDFCSLSTGLRDNNTCKVIADFLECSGLIFRKPKTSNVMGLEYFVPYFAQVPSSSEGPAAGKKDLDLYLQFISGHVATQLYFQLVFGLAGLCDSPDSLAIQATNCCVLYHGGRHITIFHEKLDDRIKFIFRKEDKSVNVKTPDVYNWLYTCCHQVLDGFKVHFILGARCPLGDSCHRNTSLSWHIVDLSEVRSSKPQLCGDVRIDTMKSVRMWIPSISQASNDTSVSNMDGAESSGKASSTDPLKMSIASIKYQLFQKICQKLRVSMTLGADWKGLAGLMGCTLEDVELYKSISDPVKQLLYDWSCKNKEPTIENFISLLKELDRPDIVDLIYEYYHLSDRSGNCDGGGAKTIDTPFDPSFNEGSSHCSGTENSGSIAMQTFPSESSQSYTIYNRSPQISRTSGSSSPHRGGGATNVNEIEETALKGNITVTERGVSNLNVTDEGAGYIANVGVTLNCVEGGSQADSHSGLNKERMITPVE